MSRPVALVFFVALVLLAMTELRTPRPREKGRAPVPPGPPLAGTEGPLPAVLEPHRATIERLLTPAAAARPGSSPVMRLGGSPRLPAGTPWPSSPARPMSFVGELDLAALRRTVPDAAPALPGDGRLLLFYDEEEMRPGYEPGDREYFRLLHVTGPGEERPPPRGAQVHREVVLGVYAVRVLPGLESFDGLGSDGADDAYGEYAAALAPMPDHRVGGHAAWIQSDAREDAAIVAVGGSTGTAEQMKAGRAKLAPGAAKEWHLLWQIDSDDSVGFMWGDVGKLYLLARDEDLRRGRFDRVWLVMQCS